VRFRADTGRKIMFEDDADHGRRDKNALIRAEACRNVLIWIVRF